MFDQHCLLLQVFRKWIYHIGHLAVSVDKPKVVRMNATEAFIEHNKKVFPKRERADQKSAPIILMEYNKMCSAHIAYSYLAHALGDLYKAKIFSFRMTPEKPWKHWLKKVIPSKKLDDTERVYKSFGSQGFIRPVISSKQKKKASKLCNELMAAIKDKRDIENITVNSVWIGDLIYDSYLMGFKKPTIEKDSTDFKEFLLESLQIFVWWDEYFNENNVHAVNVSHCVYNLAIPLRIALRRNIPAFQANLTHMYRMNKTNYFAYSDYRYFPELFAALPEDIKKAGIAEAQRRIEKRFAGEVGVDMAYSTKSAFGASRPARLLNQSPRKKILIATHCFFDSPHSYGRNIFPDFYEWLEFLGKISKEADYDWYIKTHPDYLPGTMEIIKSFVARYHKLTLLPANASHHQIIAEGIDVALTVYGTIGFEYAALGIPVINCSLNNPHISYNFNLHPKDVEEYRRLLLGLDTLEFKFDKNQVYEYYFMQYMYNTNNLFLDSYETTIEALGGYSAQFTDAVYEKWTEEWTEEKHSKIKSAITGFIASGKFRMIPPKSTVLAS